MHIKIQILFLLLIPLFLICGCQEQPEIEVPKILGDLTLSNVISGEEAISDINKLHGLSVAADQNVIAEYGEQKKDLLYISYYQNKEETIKIFQQMMDKMKAAKGSPFTHIRQISSYDDQVYIALGMGAFHYIFATENYILWLQTYQAFGRKLPPELIELYPIVKEKQNI